MAELDAIQGNLNEFSSHGATVVALCPQRQKYNDEAVHEYGLDFSVLRDADNRVADKFNLVIPTPPEVIEAERYLGLDLPKHNAAENWDLPIPSRFIIDSNGIVRHVSLSVDHREREDPLDCLNLLDRLMQ